MVYKDLFSNHASEYKRFRPSYPEPLFKYLATLVKSHHAAWDCGTGNGQGAHGLAAYFSHVYATDASEAQVNQAEPTDNITFSVATAEESGLDPQSVSLVTAFQAAHWFDFEKFYQEVKRVLLPDGYLALIGYNTAITGIDEVDETYKEFCFHYLWDKNCWDPERAILNDAYQTIDFPFDEVTAPQFFVEMHWDYQDYIAYLNTWSSVKRYIKIYNSNPVDDFVIPKIHDHWHNKGEKRVVKFPLVMRVGKLIPD